MSVIRLYKVNFINSNSRAADGNVMKEVLNELTDHTDYCIDLTEFGLTDVQPDVPFYVCTTASVQYLSEYNYLYYERDDGSAYYAIVDRYEQSNMPSKEYKGETTVRIYHHMDVFAMYGCGIAFSEGTHTASQKASGTMTRGHVNDWINYGGDVVPTVKHTFQTQEEPVNTSSLAYARRLAPYVSAGTFTIKEYNTGEELTFNCLGWLHIYITNVAGIAPSDNFKDVQRYYDTGLPVAGLLTVFPVVRYNDEFYIISIIGDEQGELEKVKDLTSEYITSMLYLPFNPFNISAEEWVKTVTGAVSTGLNDVMSFPTTSAGAVGFVRWMDAPCSLYRKSFNFWDEDEVSGGVATYHFEGDTMTLKDSYDSDYVSDGTDTTAANFETFLEHDIVKIHTSPYTQIDCNGMSICSITYRSIDYMVDPTLTTAIYFVDRTRGNEYYNISFKTLTSVVSPVSTNDYWTRLNATQESILAQQRQFSAVFSGVSSAVSAVSAGATAGATGNLGIGAQGITQAASGIVNMSYSMKYASNSMEIAEHQYQAGQTNEGGALGFANMEGWQDAPAITVAAPVKDEALRIAELLALYGYNCAIPLRKLPDHQRTAYNYVQCADYQRFDLAQSIVEEFKQIFAQGVHIWHSLAFKNWYTLDNPLYVANVQYKIPEEDE